MTESPLTSTSPSSASLISVPGIGGPTVPSLTRSGGLQVATPQVSDIPQSSPIGIPIAWKNSSTSSGRRRRADVDRQHLVEPERDAQAWRTSPRRPWPRPRRAPPAPPRRPARGAPSGRAASSALRAPSRLLVGQGGEVGLEARLELLPDPRHGEEPGRPDLRQELDDLARVRADRDRDALDHRQVVVRASLGDVRGGQPGDDLRRRARGSRSGPRPRRPGSSGCGA